MSFSVAVHGKHSIQIFNDLSVDQICSLLENPDPEEGINYAQLGATPIVEYQVMGGGRYFPSVARKEIAQAIEGIDIMVTFATNYPWYHDYMARRFFQCLIDDNLLDECVAIILRIVPCNKKSDYSSDCDSHTVDDILRTCGLNTSSLKDRLYVLADKEVSWGKHKPKLDEDVTTAIAQLRSELLTEQIAEVVMAPVKETVSAGKALLGMGQRLIRTWKLTT